ncbi:hypothetical protein D9756_011098 [Leucocoprinus leucothites]|uniref:BRCT domain-containing protein n=1 Tax=Leucocoprinus leucothites TaxID=201217 RepID=A0A8H5CNQ7_9AGAR|nr:hypothetical protein D9756_011098 [Leucoagaricus leucothites]
MTGRRDYWVDWDVGLRRDSGEITITNYTGESRKYIKRIITAMGAKLSPMMTGRNTILIAACQKTDNAPPWSPPIVNHTWLEDCFIRCRLSRCFGERGIGIRGVELCDVEGMQEDEGSSDKEAVYAGIDLKMDGEQGNEVLKRSVGEDIIVIGILDTNDPGRDTALEHIEMNETSPIQSKSESDLLTNGVWCPLLRRIPSGVLQLLSAVKKRRIGSEDEDEERIEVDEPAQLPIDDNAEENTKRQKKSGRTPRKSVAMDPKSTPVTVSSSKKQPSVDLDVMSEKGQGEEGGWVEVVISEVRKGETKVKRESDTGISATGLNKEYLMTMQVALGVNMVKALKTLGVIMASRPSQRTRLTAPQLVRTERFLCALASVPVVLQEAWVVRSAQAKQLLPFEKFVFQAAVAEKKYRMKLSDALATAK